MKTFPCTKCGECCRMLQSTLKIVKEMANLSEVLVFPYSFVDGHCEKLNPDNTCSVYEDRPLICDIDKLAKSIDPNFDMDEVYFHTANACNSMITASKSIPEEDKDKFIVKL